ncbi:MAG: AarF/UbiB family protein [Thermaerobacter sp.]|nr:AarF/UbiB family protein [Thermaerobacter sp.]
MSADRSNNPRIRSAVWRTYQVSGLFLGIMVEIVWTSFWLRGRPREETTEIWDSLFHRQSRRFRLAAEQLGGLLIKVGQFLSSRVDLMPKSVIEELQQLQDNVAPAPWAEIRPTVEADLGPLHHHFIVFNEIPVAAASLGQVYEAVLADGPRVAVKVQRPRLAAIVAADLSALSLVVTLLSRFTRYGQAFDLFIVLKEFRRTIYEEMDYSRELANTERIRGLLRDLPYVEVPKTYPQLSTSRVLVMEYRDGIKINQRERLLEAGISPTKVAERAIRLYLHMVMDIGVFHADPHPGNILVSPDGSLVLLDYGMVGSLDTSTKRLLRRLFVAISDRSPGELVESLHGLGMIRPQANRARLKRTVSYLLDRYYAETLNQLADLDIPSLFRDFEALLRDESIQVPGEFAFLGRAIAILIGLAISLDPTINLITLFAPFARRFVTEESGGLSGYAIQKAQKWGRTIWELPSLSTQILRQIEAGEIETRIDWPEGHADLKTLGRTVRGLTQSVYLVGFSATGAWLWALGHLTAGRLFFALAGLSLLVGYLRGRR